MAIAKLSIDLEARLTKLESGLKQATSMAGQSASKMQSAFKGVALTFTGLAGALSLAGIKSAFDRYVEGAASMQKLAVITGTTTEKISALNSVARLSGTDVGQLESGMVRLSAALSKAGEEGKGTEKAFSALGLDSQKLIGMGTAEALQEVAKAFYTVEEGSSKTALAVSLFGKAGAELIPFLNELATSGDLAAKVTNEQGQAAKEYEQSLRKLDAAKSAVSKTISAELVPVASVFLKTLAELITKSNDVNGAVKSLASDGSIQSWARGGALAVANLIDSFQLAKKIAIEVGSAFEVVGRTIYSIGTIAGIAFGGGSLKEKAGAIGAMREENRKIMEGIERRLEENRKPATLFSEKLQSAFGRSSTDRFLSGKAALNAIEHPTKRKISFVGDGGESSSGKVGRGRAGKELDDGSQLLQQLRDRIQATQNLTEVEKLEAAIADGKYKGATAANLEIARGYAQTLDNISAFREESEAASEEMRKQDDARKKSLEDFQRIFDATRTPAEALNIEVERLMTLLDSGVLGEGAAGLELFGRAAQQAGKRMQELDDNMEETVNRSNSFAKSAAKNIQSAFADFLFDPFEKGTKGMLKSFGETVRRMIANAASAEIGKMLFGDLGGKGGLGGIVGKGLDWLTGDSSGKIDIGGMFSKGFDWLKGLLPSFAIGTDFVPRDMVAQIHKGERIVPAAENRQLGSSGHSVSVIINMGGNGNSADVRRAGGAVAREVLGALSTSRRYA